VLAEGEHSCTPLRGSGVPPENVKI
jgi:hypothetical protein